MMTLTGITLGIFTVADRPRPSLQASRDGCPHLAALLLVKGLALLARVGFENVAYRCTRIHPMQGIHRLFIAAYRRTLPLLHPWQPRSGKSGQTRQTVEISGCGGVGARPLKCGA